MPINPQVSTGTQPQDVAPPYTTPPKPYEIRIRRDLVRKAQLPPHALALYVNLAAYADADGWCWPSVATLAREACMSERAVRNALAVLRGKGLVDVEYRAAAVSRYRIVPPPLVVFVPEGEAAPRAGWAAPPAGHPAPPAGHAAPPAASPPVQPRRRAARRADEGTPATATPQAPEKEHQPKKASAAGAAAPLHGTNGHSNGHRPPTAEQGSLLPAVVAPPPEEPTEALWASHPIKALFQSYECQYLARQVRLGKAEADRHPPFGGKEAALAKRMLAQYGVPRVRALVAAFFSWDHADAWTSRVGYHFASFHQQLGRLTSATPIDTLDARTMGNVKAAYSFATAPPNRRTL